MLDLIKEETTSSRLTVIGVFHDVNIASLYCDRLLLLHEGKTDMLGLPHHVLTTERINRVYETNVTPLQHPIRANPQLMVEPSAPSKTSIVNIADGWRTYGSEGMTFSINQPLRILTSHKENGGFFWKRSIGTGTKTLHHQLEPTEDMLFFEQAKGLAKYATEDAEDDMILYSMLQQEKLNIWLILKRSLSDGAAVQLIGQLMHIIKQETSIPIHHLCIAAPNTQETEDVDLLHDRLGQKVYGLLHKLKVIQK